MISHWLRNFIPLFFIVSVIKMVYMRLRVDWGEICLYLAIVFHATWALPEEFEFFDNVGLIFYLTFELFSTPQIGYDPVGSKIRIINVNIWSNQHSQAENNGVGYSFKLHLLGLKQKNPIFRFATFYETWGKGGTIYWIFAMQ